MKVKILADSASDLTERFYKEMDIEIVPLTVHLEGREYKDGSEISPKEVYDAMRLGSIAKTSQVSPKAFKETFMSYVEKEQPLVYVSFSSELSGTYQTAKMIEQEIKEEHPSAQLYIIDSKSASIGYGLAVLSAAKLANNGASVEEITNNVIHYREHMEHIFTVDDLEYLYRGGRVSKTAAFVGTLLKIKPILHVEDGKLIPLEKIRGTKRVLGRMLEIMEERGTDLEDQVIGISHGDDLERAEQLARLIKEKFKVKDVVIEMVGSVIGAHAGPGTIALFFLNKPYQ